MTRPPLHQQRRKYLVILIIAAVLAVLYMTFLARTDTSLPTVSRRPGSPSAITYQRNPTAFLFGFIPLVMLLFLFGLIVSTVASGVTRLVRGENHNPHAPSRAANGTGLRVASAILSAAVPGLGQAFGAHFMRATAWLLAFITTTVLALLMFMQVPSIVGVILPLLFVGAMRVAVVVDAARLEMSRPNIRWTRRANAVAGFAIVYLVATSGFNFVQARMFGEAFRLPSGSMEPSLLMGDYVMTVPTTASRVVRQQIILFRWPADAGQFVARIVGMPGDTVTMRAHQLYINGRLLNEPYAANDSAAFEPAVEMFAWQENVLADTTLKNNYRPTRHNWGPLIVPPDSFFVMGDNRDNAFDSRYRGFVPANTVRLTPQRVYYSRDAATGALRWNRIGKIIKSTGGQSRSN